MPVESNRYEISRITVNFSVKCLTFYRKDLLSYSFIILSLLVKTIEGIKFRKTIETFRAEMAEEKCLVCHKLFDFFVTILLRADSICYSFLRLQRQKFLIKLSLDIWTFLVFLLSGQKVWMVDDILNLSKSFFFPATTLQSHSFMAKMKDKNSAFLITYLTHTRTSIQRRRYLSRNGTSSSLRTEGLKIL